MMLQDQGNASGDPLAVSEQNEIILMKSVGRLVELGAVYRQQSSRMNIVLLIICGIISHGRRSSSAPHNLLQGSKLEPTYKVAATDLLALLLTLLLAPLLGDVSPAYGEVVIGVR